MFISPPEPVLMQLKYSASWIKMRNALIWLVIGIFFYSCNNAEDGRPKNPQAEYSSNSPGEWSGLEETHSPEFILENPIIGKTNIIIKMKASKYFSQNHYVQRVGIYNADKIDIVTKELKRPTNGEFQKIDVTLDLPEHADLNKRAMVYAKCNLHDTWVVPLKPEKN